MQQHAQSIGEHMEVVGSDGGHVGTVDKVEGDRIKLTRKDDPDGSGQHHHYLPLGSVASVSGGQVRLGMSAQEAKRQATSRTDEGLGAQAGVTGAGTMVAGQTDMAESRNQGLGGMGDGGAGLREGVPDTGAEAGAAGSLSGDSAPGTIKGR